MIPFISDRARSNLSNEYLPGAGHKALAVSQGTIGFAINQPSDEAASTEALEICQKRADNIQPARKCELYAIGDTVVYAQSPPPMPPKPWIGSDHSIERPFASKDVPIIRDAGKAILDKGFAVGRKSKALAMGPGGHFYSFSNQDKPEEAARRALENCGAMAGTPCMVVALDDVFVVPLPTVLKAVGFFRPANHLSIAADARDDVARQLATATSGWNVVAVGAAGRPGLALKAASEQDAVNEALANCGRQDRDCRVIAIGPFSVGLN
jgi:hypothetical protein